eukprot:4673960-Prymnesium_polylepis.1
MCKASSRHTGGGRVQPGQLYCAHDRRISAPAVIVKDVGLAGTDHKTKAMPGGGGDGELG